MTRTFRTSRALAAACLTAITAIRADAADVLSTHNPFNGNWSNAGDWANSPPTGGFPNNGNAGIATYDAFIANVTVTLDLNITIEALTLTGATISGTNSLTTNGLLNWATGVINGPGIINANGGINMPGISRAFIGRTINSPATTDWGNGTIQTGNAAVFNNSGTFTTSFNGTFAFNLGGTRTVFNNTGIFRKAGGAAATVMEAAFNSSGSTQINNGQLRLTGGGTSSGSFAVAQGTTLEISSQNFNLTAPATVTGEGTLRILTNVTHGGTTDIRFLDIDAATLTTTPGATPNSKIHVATQLTLTGGSTLDLANNAMILNHAGASPQALIRARLQTGYANGAWNGNGIISTSAAAEPKRGIGYGEASTVFGISGTQTANFLGKTVDATSFLMRHTLPGDTNLDGQITFVDLLTVSANFGASAGNQTWTTGDLNYDGSVTFVDLLGVAANFGSTLPSSIPGASNDFNAALAAAAAHIPEPAFLSLLAPAALLFRRSRARQRRHT